MFRYSSKLTLLFLVALNTSYSIAHGGRLNSSGCHNDRKNYDYHCHRSKNKAEKTQSLYLSSGAFKNCSAARSIGVVNIHHSDKRCGRHLDRDNDGIACEAR